MNLFKTIFLIVLVGSICFHSLAQRTERPIQIQLNFSGVFLNTFSNSLANKEVDDLAVGQWGIPGLSVGYHLNRKIYLGYNFSPNRTLVLRESWSFTGGDLDGNIVVDHNTGSSHSIEGRFSPFRFGLYLSASLIHVSKAQYTQYFTRKGPTAEMGGGTYATDFVSTWNFKELNTVALGLGYNHVSPSGFSFNLGLSMPVPTAPPLHENIKIVATENVEIASSDLVLGIKTIEDETFFYPMQLNMSLGYNF